MFKPLTRKITHWWFRQETIHKLEGLDDRLLSDMGTTREDIACFVDAELDHHC